MCAGKKEEIDFFTLLIFLHEGQVVFAIQQVDEWFLKLLDVPDVAVVSELH